MADFSEKRRKKDYTLIVQGDVTIEDASSFKKNLSRLLKRTKDVRIDCSEVTSMHVSGVQIICSAFLHVAEQKKSLSITEKSRDILEKVFEQVGLQEHPVFSPEQMAEQSDSKQEANQ